MANESKASNNRSFDFIKKFSLYKTYKKYEEQISAAGIVFLLISFVHYADEEAKQNEEEKQKKYAINYDTCLYTDETDYGGE
jgi:hypothetical protein